MTDPHSRPRAGEPHLLVLKIGGSLLSDKRETGETDLSAVGDFAVLVSDLVDRFPGRVVLVTGGGALCHAVGLKVDPNDPFSALALTEPAFTMRWAWTSRLRELGVRAVPLQATAMFSERPGGETTTQTEVVRRLLAEDALPVLSSDCVVASDGSLRILSSDHVAGIPLDDELSPVRIVTLTDVPGILTGGPDSPVLAHLDPDDLPSARRLFWPTDEWDATGAMAGKVEALAEHARRGAECVIMRGDRRADSLAYLFAPMSEWPESVPRTVISRPDAAPRREPGRVVLLNPGPVNVHRSVRAAIASRDECHREPEAQELLASVARKVVEICGGDDSYAAVLLTGSGTAALEAVISSAVPAEGRLLVVDNGHYGERLARIAQVHGIDAERLEFGWANPVDLDAVDRALAADSRITHVGMVHHETSTGMLNPLDRLGRLVARHGRSLVVDAISSFGAERLDVVADHVDWCVGTANKCLEGLPGISFVVAPKARFEALVNVPRRTFYLDLHADYRSQAVGRTPRFTPALQVARALDAALDLALVEGVEARGERYRARAEALRAGLIDRGVELLLPERHRSGSITNAYLSNGMTYDELHDGLKERGYVIYATQEKSAGVFRLANMGQLTHEDVVGFFAAFDEVVARHTPTRFGRDGAVSR
ncbi:aminotransferase class V-fold PLP-dependent enzyme [Streptosporangium carneum]|uniref:2-aminoethylphosphonate--pyruvate transaminase n=1 Tax=Streptosporangium carneum TaxID=47481 RepID=A0A9W6I8K2_9ACTN|nr:aminotransferase class V-fold PLP-dependent enzyme [Streptosporangium carneum]GLK13193.1 hypothetical protein GCM10017600_66040 [Streptosporangium carneum]